MTTQNAGEMTVIILPGGATLEIPGPWDERVFDAVNAHHEARAMQWRGTIDHWRCRLFGDNYTATNGRTLMKFRFKYHTVPVAVEMAERSKA